MHLSHVTVPEYHTDHCASFVHSNSNGTSASGVGVSVQVRTMIQKNNTSNECRMWALVNIPLKSIGESRNCGLKCTPVGKHPLMFFDFPSMLAFEICCVCKPGAPADVISLCSSQNKTKSFKHCSNSKKKKKKLAKKNVRGHVLSFWKWSLMAELWCSTSPYVQSAVKSLTLENKSDVVLHLEALLVKREIISHFEHNFRLQT